MAVYITASGAASIGTRDGLMIQVNTALTGSITLQAGGVTFAVITNPTVGSQYRYTGLRGMGAITVNPSATTDITVNILSAR